MRPLTRLAAATVLAAGVPAAALAAAGPTAIPTIRTQTVLASDVLPGLTRLAPLAAAPPGRELEVGVALRDPGAAAELRALDAMYDPASPTYGHFLTPGQVGADFGPRPATVSAVTRWLTRDGLRVDLVSAARDYVSAYGPAAAVERAFGVRELVYRADGRTFLANPGAPRVPAGLGIFTVVGLNTWQRFAVPHVAALHLAAIRRELASGGVNVSGTTPQGLWSVYDQPAAYAGQGRRMAIIGEGDPAVPIADLRDFERYFHLPVVPVHLHCVERGSCGSDTSGNGEWDIDFQASTGMAPRVRALDLFFAQSIADPSINLAFLGWVDDPSAPRQASASLGECEQTPANPLFEGPLNSVNGNNNPNLQTGLLLGDGEEPVISTALEHAALEGRTLFASAGDSGSSCGAVEAPVIGGGNGIVNNGVPDVDFPAASPFAVAVGGTVLYTTTTSPVRRVAEYAWTYTGGGTSYFLPASKFQASEAHVVGRCLSSPSGSTADTGLLCRGIPDVAAQSGDILTNGYDIYSDGAFTPAGGAGTSLSSPLWLGMWTRVQSSAPDRAGYGFAGALLYRLGTSASYARDFYNITVGCNGTYCATPGWNYVSGFGTPKVAGIIADARRYAPRG